MAADGSVSPVLPAGALERHGDLHVLRVSGDDYEMGFQHGAALREAVRRGPVPAFAKFVARLFAPMLGQRAGELAAAALSHTVGRSVAAGFPAHARRSLEGLADGAGLKRGELIRAVTMPETYLWFVSRLIAAKGVEVAPRHQVPTIGCTSAIAFGEATADGAMLHGRNFDYQGVGTWDAEGAVVFHEPKGAQAYASVTSAGVLFGGITAMNEAGLTLAVHQHLACDALKLGGTPVGVVGDRIMREATGLDDAKRILDEHRPIGCWTYLVGSAREKRVLCYEISPELRRALFFDEGTFAYSNLYLDRELAARERHLYPSHARWNAARIRHARERLEAMRGRITADDVASILGDRVDPDCRLRAAISCLQTVGSVVFRPTDGVFFVGSGAAPASNRPYVAFDLKTRSARPDLAPLTGGVPAEGELKAFERYRDAYRAWFEADDLPAARAAIGEACALLPREAAFRFVAALLALQAGDLDHAGRQLDEAIALGHPDPERVAGFHLWRGRVRDLSARRGEALADYRRALAGDEPVRKAAQKGQAKPWRRRRFSIEFTLGDVVVP
jgi:isopenicillin-N N-acyltransferase like protein